MLYYELWFIFLCLFGCVTYSVTKLLSNVCRTNCAVANKNIIIYSFILDNGGQQRITWCL